MWLKVSEYGSIWHVTHAPRWDLSCRSIIREWNPARIDRHIGPCPACIIISDPALRVFSYQSLPCVYHHIRPCPACIIVSGPALRILLYKVASSVWLGEFYYSKAPWHAVICIHYWDFLIKCFAIISKLCSHGHIHSPGLVLKYVPWG